MRQSGVIADFMAATRTAANGRIGTRVQKVRMLLGWPKEIFDEVVRYTRDRRMIQLSMDAWYATPEELDGAFVDENGFRMVTVRLR